MRERQVYTAGYIYIYIYIYISHENIHEINTWKCPIQIKVGPITDLELGLYKYRL